MDFQDQNIIHELLDKIKNHIDSKHLNKQKIIDFEMLFAKTLLKHSPKINTHDNEALYHELDDSLEGLNALNTSFKDFFQILEYLNKKHKSKTITICDIGAGYGKLSIIASLFFKNIKVISVEPVKERTWLLECLGKKKSIYHEFFNEIHCELPFDYAFFYFPVCHALDDILNLLEKKKDFLGIIAIESHGDFFSRLSLEKDWLEDENIARTSIPRHDNNIKLYERIKKKQESPLKRLYLDIKHRKFEYVLGNDSLGTWVEKLCECEINFFYEDEFVIQSLSSHRNFKVDQNHINELELTNKVPKNIENLLHKRSQSIEIDGQKIRKIYMHKKIELSNGKLVDL